jgi:phosphopantothenate-cysteine ligase
MKDNMKIVITAGGTSEPIDDVRRITNSSTGSLGYAIGSAFVNEWGDQIDKIYYLHGMHAKYVDNPLVEPVEIGGVMDLQRELTEILTREHIDAVVHAMAVSDYMVDQVTTVRQIRGDAPEDAPVVSGNKISSSIEDLAVILKQSPKVIGEIKKLSPSTHLVGFKLLSGVPHEELIDVGYKLLQKNSCDYVLANDLQEIGKGRHKGYLIHQDKSYDTMLNNEDIATMIASRVMDACMRKEI